MSEDILHTLRTARGDSDINFTPEIYNEALIKLEDLCLVISNEALMKLGLPSPNRPASDLFNRDLQREELFDVNELDEFVQNNLPKMLPEQKTIYDTIMHAIAAE